MAAELMEAELAAGGLATYDAEGRLLHVTPHDVAKAVRFLVARLTGSDDIVGLRSIALTSALEGEGVTFVSRSLAAVWAHDLDQEVCLVETNWWTPDDEPPHDHPTFGLADVLAGSGTVAEAVVRTSEPGLAVVPSGTLPVADRAAVASSSAFVDAIDGLIKTFDMVVIDCPPLLKASEATTIVRQADRAVLVVRHGVTTEHQVREAAELVSGTELLGAVINRWASRIPRRLQRLSSAT